MRGSASACLLALGASSIWAACGSESPAAASIDLLARRPDGPDDGRVHVDLDGRRVRLEPGATARYRIEPRVPGTVHLGARAGRKGTLEGRWLTVDLAAGTETEIGGGSWPVSGTRPEQVESGLPDTKELLELRLTWDAAPGGGELELSELALRESAPVERPGIVLIVIDTLSARHLSVYGYPLETDPELARFASEAYVFENCFTNAPWTVPSFMALLTGIYARAHALDPPAGPSLWERWHLDDSRWTLAEAVRAAGYRTAGFVDSAWITEPFGVPQGFDLYDASACTGTLAVQGIPEGGIRRTAALAQGYLETLAPGEPFLVLLHAFDVHGPYLAKPSSWPVQPAAEPYDTARVRPAGGSSQAYGIIPAYIARGAVPAGELPSPMPTAPFERAYDMGIRFVDEELGRFFGFLRERGLLERSWVVLTADHGEMMADSSYLFSHGVLDQDVMRVPLLIRPPGGRPGEKRLAEAVQLVDLYPTLLELAGLGARTPQHGRSLVPLLEGGTRPPDVILAETGITRQAMLIAGGWKLVELEPTQEVADSALLSHPLLGRLMPPLAELEAQPRKHRHLKWLEDVELRRDFLERLPAVGVTEELVAQMQTRKQYPSLLAFLKLVLRGQHYQLYDLGVDPRAEHDIAAEHPEKLAEMKALLRAEQGRRSEASQLARPPERVELPPEDVEALRALGYGGAEDE